eukprot:7292012-Heterocapsa_arctica.AAC.1
MKWTSWVVEGRARGKAPRGELLEGDAAGPIAGVAQHPAGGVERAAEEEPVELGARMPMLPARTARSW